MDRWSDNPPIVSTLKLIFFGLAICVFLWGLQYKLSLYDPIQANSHQIPTAKLLSKDDSTGLTAILSATHTTPSESAVPSLLFTTCIIMLVMRSAAGLPAWNVVDRSSRMHWHHRARASFNAFAFRPPPISA